MGFDMLDKRPATSLALVWLVAALGMAACEDSDRPTGPRQADPKAPNVRWTTYAAGIRPIFEP